MVYHYVGPSSKRNEVYHSMLTMYKSSVRAWPDYPPPGSTNASGIVSHKPAVRVHQKSE